MKTGVVSKVGSGVRHQGAISLLLVATALAACSGAGSTSSAGASTPGEGAAGVSGEGAGGAGAGGAAQGASGKGASAGVSNGVDAAGGGNGIDKGCGYAQIATEREPGAILIVFDQSSSMEEDVDGNKPDDKQQFDPSQVKWKLTTSAVKQMLGELPQDAAVGMLLFPNDMAGDKCVVNPQPQVAVGPLSMTGPSMTGYLSSGTPQGGSVTPLAQALTAGHVYLDGLSVKGQRAVLLVTDGAPSILCGMANDETAAIAASAFGEKGYRTFVIGLNGSAETLLSKTAHLGGADRAPGCKPDCGSDPFANDTALCCHYAADGPDTASVLAKALAEVASKTLASCVFTVPKGTDPEKFDPAQVNVLVSIDGGEAKLVPQDAQSGWSYVGGKTDQVEITGPLCDEILSKSSNVEILLGCPTGQIK